MIDGEIVARLGVLAGVHALAVLSPGPDLAVVIRNSLARGRAAGLWTAAGIGLGNGVHIVLALVGIGVVAARAPVLLHAMKWAAAAYLVWLGIRALRATAAPETARDDASETRVAPRGRWLRIGFLTSALNPKAMLFYFAMFTVLLDPAALPRWAAVLMGAYLPAASVAIFSLVALLASLGRTSRFYARFGIWLDRAMGATLILVGLHLALTKIGSP